MRRSPLSRVPLRRGLVLWILALSASRGVAEEMPPVDPAVEKAISTLGSPLERGAVSALVSLDTVAADPRAALRVVGVLWHAPGYAAAMGLRTLAGHADAEVRATALRGVARVGIRLDRGMEQVRKARKDRQKDARLAAYEAIGRVGDATDVPDLLDASAADDVFTREAAFRALNALTGERIPWQTSRWTAWWDEAQTELPPRIRSALDAFESGVAGAELEDSRSLLLRHAWAALDVVTESVRAWLRSSDVRLRMEGYRFAAALRLGDLSEEVSSAFRYERNPVAWPVGQEAALALGTPTDGVKPPTPSASEQDSAR